MNNHRTIICPCCFNSGIDPTQDDATPCPLCPDQCGMITEEERREWVAVRTLVRFADLEIPLNLRLWTAYIERERHNA